jgi:hypothetical protein
MKRIIIIATALGLSGCASTGQTPLIKPQIVEKPKFEVPAPHPIQSMAFEWVVITKDNFELKFKEIENKNGSVTLFAMTPQGYQNLSMNVAEMRRYMQQQNAVIAAMKKYYESSNTDAAQTVGK